MQTSTEHGWLDVLRAAVQGTPGGAAGVSRQLVGDTSKRPAISLALAGRYFGKRETLQALVETHLMQIDCPHLAAPISPADCRTVALSRAPIHNPLKMRHWQACRRCPMRPEMTDEQ
ncbi:LacI family transcriptional regulator [Chitinivorax sp. PXF-14]|uniref:LacI family transcriptional regulator n=1 Tax=Chitinivorax sp. PXF-14 TaxID=3230488 RepID=UPI003466EFB5